MTAARNLAFLANLMEAKAKFVCCDNRTLLNTSYILRAVAEHERKTISKRTKDARTAAKRRGMKLWATRS